MAGQQAQLKRGAEREALNVVFVKLDAGILDSSLWQEKAETRIVFVTMLAMSNAEGVCLATAPGIARRANLPLAAVRRALETLAAPDADSRTDAESGRRIKRVDGGFLLVNYLKYRMKDHTAAARKRRQRERQADGDQAEGDMSRRDIVTVTQGEGEAEGEVETHPHTHRDTTNDPLKGRTTTATATTAPRIFEVIRDRDDLGFREKRNGEWGIDCPACDKPDAVSVTKARDGASALVCPHCGCDTAEVLAALDLTMADLYPRLPAAAR